jgi:hypothetical protein
VGQLWHCNVDGFSVTKRMMVIAVVLMLQYTCAVKERGSVGVATTEQSSLVPYLVGLKKKSNECD